MARQLFLDAQAYNKKIKAAKGKADKMPERKPQLEALVEVLDGKRIVHFHTHRYDDILTAIRLQQEFKIKMVLQHVSEAWKAAVEIVASGIPAAFTVRDGMSLEKALEGLTIAGAKMLELQDRVGSLEVGKDADFVILSGEPFSVYTHVEQTWVEGTKRFDLANPEDKKFAVGGSTV